MQFNCPHCDHRLERPDKDAGQTIQCPSCEREITVPAPAAGHDDLTVVQRERANAPTILEDDNTGEPQRAESTVIDGVYGLRKKIGKGATAVVYRATVDLVRFDYTTLYAYTQVSGETHLERRAKAEEFAARLADKDLDLATIRTILEAQDIPVPGNEVAVKVAIGAMDPQRFEAEWKNLLCLSHPNVIEVYGGGTYQGRKYYAMEYIKSIISASEIADAFTVKQKLDVIIQAGKGLAYLHDNGLIHRDVKPANMVTFHNDAGQCITKVTDLGIGKAVGEDLGLTTTDTIMGTPHYMPPEQVTSTKDADHRADIYSLGASLYEVATGQAPFHGKTAAFEIIAAHVKGELPTPAREIAPDLPEVVASIIACAMAPDVESRYQRMHDMVKDLETYVAEESAELTASLSYAAVKESASTAHAGGGRYVFESLARGKGRKRKAARKPAGTKPVIRLNKKTIAGAVGVAALVVVASLTFRALKDRARQDPGPEPPAKVATPGPRRKVGRSDYGPFLKPLPMPKAKGVSHLGLSMSVLKEFRRWAAADSGLFMMAGPKGSGKGTTAYGVLNEMNLRGRPLLEHGFGAPAGPAADAAAKAMADAEPHVIVMNETIDKESMQAAVDFARAGHLVLAIVDLPGNRAFSVPTELKKLGLNKVHSWAPVLEGVAAQRLYHRKGGRAAMIEVMPVTPEIRALIKAGADPAKLKELAVKQGMFPLEDIAENVIKSGKAKVDDIRKMLPEFRSGAPASDPASALHAALTKANPKYNGKGKLEVRGGKVTKAVMESCGLTDLSPFRGLPLRQFQCWKNQVTDLSPLAGMQLTDLVVAENRVRDISVVKGMPLNMLGFAGNQVADLSPVRGSKLKQIYMDGNNITDVTPLEGMQLEAIVFDVNKITKGMDVLRNMNSIKRIGTGFNRQLSPAEFWKKYDAGEFKPKPDR